MDFSHKKLSSDQASQMRTCSIQTISPYALMIAPAYVYMEKNEKFVAVKSPMDFFTPEELENLKSVKFLFFPTSVDLALVFREAGRNARNILLKTAEGADQDEDGAVVPPPYQVSDALLRIVGSLWGKGGMIEPFFAAVFANEVCDLIPSETLMAARDRDVEAFEKAVLFSGWTAFLALHFGYCDFAFVNRIRLSAFDGILSGNQWGSPRVESDEIKRLAFLSFGGGQKKKMNADFLMKISGRSADKLTRRLERVITECIKEEEPVASIYGEGGFIDV